MRMTKPAYFDAFRCIAHRCPDSCCKEWAVQVDAGSAAFYRSLPGPLGDRLRQVLREEDGQTVMTITDGRCPMWQEDGLCRIQAELGEGALCKTCREFPRLTHDYGDFVERGLELSCPEAAGLILSAPPAPLLEFQISGGSAPEYDREAMEVLLSSRKTALRLLSDPVRPAAECLILLLFYGLQAQSELDGEEAWPFDADAALADALTFGKPGDWNALTHFFLDLELLTREWETLLLNPRPVPWAPEHLALARYLVERYWLQAVSDYDLYSRVKFIVISCLLVKHLGREILTTAQLFSKEIENDAENVDAILDGAYSHPAFTDDKLLGLLLEL